MRLRRFNDGCLYAVFTNRLPSQFDVAILVMSGIGLWLDQWGDLPENVLEHLPSNATRLRGLVYMGKPIRNIAALERYVDARTLWVTSESSKPVDLSGLPKLRMIDGLRPLKYTSSVLSNPQLTWVSLSSPTAAHLAQLPPTVTSLVITQPPPCDFSKFAFSATLEYLDIRDSRDYQIRGFESLASLKTLNLYSLKGETKGFASLSKLDSLTKLFIENVDQVDEPGSIKGLRLKYFWAQGILPFSTAQLRHFDAIGVEGNRAAKGRD